MNGCLKRVKELEKEYIEFMGIDYFPTYSIELFEINQSDTDAVGFGSVAQTRYDPKTDKHTLLICTNLEIKKYVVFHEFTHILDAEIYAKADSLKYMYSSGYTEYHASQVELMCLLGASRISDKITADINDIIDTFPCPMSIGEYISRKHEFVLEMMSREDFPASLEALKVTLGVIFNYMGLRSICRMFIQGYIENVDNTVILGVYPLQLWKLIDELMDGWFDTAKVELSYILYSNALIPLIKEYNLA